MGTYQCKCDTNIQCSVRWLLLLIICLDFLKCEMQPFRPNWNGRMDFTEPKILSRPTHYDMKIILFNICHSTTPWKTVQKEKFPDVFKVTTRSNRVKQWNATAKWYGKLTARKRLLKFSFFIRLITNVKNLERIISWQCFYFQNWPLSWGEPYR